MAKTRIVSGRSSARTVRVQASGSGSRVLPIAPTGFTSDGGASIVTIDRQGRIPLTRVDGPKQKTLSFTIELGHLDWQRSIAPDVTWLESQRNAGRRIKFSGMPRQFSGWWMIESMPVAVEQLTPTNQPSRVSLTISLVAHADFTGKVHRAPSKPPKKPSAPKAKNPVYRWHTVKRDDWLTKLAVRYLGSSRRWPEIYRANKKEIDRRGNPDLIFPGQRFKIPPK